MAGAALLGGYDAVTDAMETGLRASDFGVPGLRALWSAIERLHAARGGIDTITVVDALERDRQLDAAGGAAAVAALAAALPTAAGIATHSRIVMELAQLRRLSAIARVLGEAAVSRESPSSEILADTIDALHQLSARQADDLGVVDRAATVARVLERGGRPPDDATPTGFSDLDHMLGGGLRPGALYVVAARPAMGKSALAHQMASYIADHGHTVGMFSMEMSGDELIEREIASASQAPPLTWGRREEGARAAAAAARVSSRSLLLIDRAGLDPSGLTARIRRLVQRHGASAIFVDYLQLVRPSEAYRGDRNNEVSEVTAALKVQAQNLKLPIVLLSQLNRKVEERADKRPGLADLRDSGSIEQDANVVIFLFRPEYYLRDSCPADKRGVCEVIVAKNRSGPTGTVLLRFDGPTTRFTAAARETRDVPGGHVPTEED